MSSPSGSSGRFTIKKGRKFSAALFWLVALLLCSLPFFEILSHHVAQEQTSPLSFVDISKSIISPPQGAIFRVAIPPRGPRVSLSAQLNLDPVSMPALLVCLGSRATLLPG
jgi:hypothetical protein